MSGPAICGLLLLFTLGAEAAAQVRVSAAGRNAPRNELERQLLMLSMADKRAASMQAIWKTGKPAVPMLAGAVKRGGADAEAALQVLIMFGGEAAPAAPILRQLLGDAKEPRRTQLANAIAQLEGDPCILVAGYGSSKIYQFDLDGKLVREVAGDQPWGVWPLPDDEIGMISYGTGTVRRMKWSGEVAATVDVVKNMTSCHALADGHHITTNWSGDGLLARRNSKGEAVWEKKIDAIRSRLHFGELFVVTRKLPKLITFDIDGNELASIDTKMVYHCVRPLPSGNLLLGGRDRKIIELTRKGKVIAEMAAPARVTDIYRLRDGRTVVAGENGLYMLDAAGQTTWKNTKVGYCGPIFVRSPW